jgi:hypothetical protein
MSGFSGTPAPTHQQNKTITQKKEKPTTTHHTQQNSHHKESPPFSVIENPIHNIYILRTDR